MIPFGLLPPRPLETHKGEAGRVFLLAGSVGLSGAAALCTMGALRAGAGLVTLGIPQSLHDAMAGKLTETMLKLLPDTPSGSLSEQGLPEILGALESADAFGFGPGLSQHEATRQLVHRLVPQLRRPTVIDADGLNALSHQVELLQSLACPAIITPHPGEMARLARTTPDQIQRRREETAKDFAARHRVVVVLKGYRTVVAGPDGACYINETGNPGMASGGCGDVLTGLMTALLGQGLVPFDAAQLGVYLHGLAGDLAAQTQGQIGLIASDVIDTIPLAIRRYQEHSLP